MPFDCYWLSKEQVLLIEASGDLTIETFRELVTTEYHPSYGDGKIHAIITTDKVTSIPSIREFGHIKPSKTGGYVILVSAQMTIVGRFLASTAMRLMRLPLYITTSIEEGCALLNQLTEKTPTTLSLDCAHIDLSELEYTGRIGDDALNLQHEQ